MIIKIKYFSCTFSVDVIALKGGEKMRIRNKDNRNEQRTVMTGRADDIGSVARYVVYDRPEKVVRRDYDVYG